MGATGMGFWCSVLLELSLLSKSRIIGRWNFVVNFKFIFSMDMSVWNYLILQPAIDRYRRWDGALGPAKPRDDVATRALPRDDGGEVGGVIEGHVMLKLVITNTTMPTKLFLLFSSTCSSNLIEHSIPVLKYQSTILPGYFRLEHNKTLWFSLTVWGWDG